MRPKKFYIVKSADAGGEAEVTLTKSEANRPYSERSEMFSVVRESLLERLIGKKAYARVEAGEIVSVSVTVE